MAHTGAEYDDPGTDYYTRRNPERTRLNALNQLRRLGYQVTLAPAPPQPRNGAGAEIFASNRQRVGSRPTKSDGQDSDGLWSRLP
jgi:hypothetical protein